MVIPEIKIKVKYTNFKRERENNKQCAIELENQDMQAQSFIKLKNAMHYLLCKH